MKELRREFVRETVSSLEILINKFSAEQNDLRGEPLRREIFRRLHSVKGTSQTFGLVACSMLAHKIENLLQAAAEGRIKPDENFKLLILEGVGILLENFRSASNNREAISPRAYLEKINELAPETAAARTAADLILREIPPEFLGVLSNHEINLLAAYVENGAAFYLVETFFNLAEFSERFKEFKNFLSERGEVAAAAPAPDAAHGSIGFRFFFTTHLSPEQVEMLIEPFDARILYPEGISHSEDAVRGVLNQARRAGEQAARSLGKQIDFEIEAGEIEIAPGQLKLFFEASVHLVRNAVDHAIETPEERTAAGKNPRGKIKLSLGERAIDLVLCVVDDGRGIDREKVRARAARRNLAAPDAALSDEEILRLIFEHGFSTSETVSEISGRGVGLDAVKDAAEKAGGGVRVSSEKNRGTTFEVYLPKEDEPPREKDAEEIK